MLNLKKFEEVLNNNARLNFKGERTYQPRPQQQTQQQPVIDERVLRDFLIANRDEILGDSIQMLSADIKALCLAISRARALRLMLGWSIAHEAAAGMVPDSARNWARDYLVGKDADVLCERIYRNAGRKIVWLSTVCKAQEGESFICRYVDRNDLVQQVELCDCFWEAVHNTSPETRIGGLWQPI